jgi:cation-transporting ATPase 13A2
MGGTHAYAKLTPHIPAGALISFPVITSVLVSFAIQLGFQIWAYVFPRRFSFYVEPPDSDSPSASGNLSYENTTIFWVSSFQYLSTCVAFAVSKPFRKPLYTNVIFTVSLIVMVFFNIFLIACPYDESWGSWAVDFFEFKEYDDAKGPMSE